MEFELRSLLVFRHLAACGSFSETGKHWGISQPAVSLTISKLETTLGLVLFERSPTGAKLTTDGHAFLPRAEDVCQRYAELIDSMRTWNRRQSGEVSVACDGSAMGRRLFEDLKAGRVPNLPTKVTALDLVNDWGAALEGSRFDLALSGRFLRAGLESGVQEGVLLRERGITVAWNPMFHSFDTKMFSFPEILKSTVLIPNAKVVAGFAEFLRRWCHEAYGVQPAHLIDFDTEQAAASACKSGLGVMLAPGDLMPRLGEDAQHFESVRTFEFLLPQAFTYGIYCRSEESSKEVLNTAAAISTHLMKGGKRSR